MSQNKSGFESAQIDAAEFKVSPRRAVHFKIKEILQKNPFAVSSGEMEALTKIDLIYRSLCGILFNFVPTSGHPGGSISSGRIVEGLLYQMMDYDFSNPQAPESDLICYAAGHKAMGLYAMWALRNECVRISKPGLLPGEKHQLRLEDLLGFRRNPITASPLFGKYNAKALDGHPTPMVPFVKLATGASGVGLTTAVGLAFGALDTYRELAPKVHILEGEGGMTPGRVQEAMATAASAQINNIVLHIDWNQSSIDSDIVCREGSTDGEYVQWTPADLAWMHDWNVIEVPDGFDFKQILAAQKIANTAINNDQPTAIIYRTTKGWKYGVEHAPSHGAGHGFCSDGFYQSLFEFEQEFQVTFPRFEGEASPENRERSFFDYLLVIRSVLEKDKQVADTLTKRIEESLKRLESSKRVPHSGSGNLSKVYEDESLKPDLTPEELQLEPGKSVTLRGVLGDTLGYLNRKSGGAFIGSAADLFGSTSVSNLAKGLSEGYYNYQTNPNARLIRTGGICEDAMGGFMAGLSSFGNHLGVGSSYGAFIAALQHVPARLHAIAQETNQRVYGKPANPFVIICGHAGPRTGEDGPTHADPQPLQLMQENFPPGSVITLTPWDTQEIWPLVIESIKRRPAVIVPFVTRPSEKVVDRVRLGFPDASTAAKGVYALRKADMVQDNYHGTLVLQGNAVGHIFATEVISELDAKGVNLNVFYIASAELFDGLSDSEKEEIFPDSLAREAMGITEFTMPTLYRWVTSREGRKRSLHAFAKGHFSGSGQADKVLEEVGLDAGGQIKAILDYARFMEQSN
jgi:transketolase